MELKKITQIFCRTYFINGVGTTLINSTFVLLLSTVKGFTPSQVSLLVGTIPLIIIPMALVWGKIIDKDKKLMKWSGILNIAQIIALLLFFVVDNFYMFFVIHLVRSIFAQPTGSAMEEYIITLANKAKVPYGKIRIYGTVSFGLAGVLSALILIKGNAVDVLAIGIILLIISVIFYFKLPELAREELLEREALAEKEGLVEEKKEDGFSLALFKNKQYVILFIIVALTFGTMNAAGGYGTQIALLELNTPAVLIGIIPFIMVTLEALIFSVVHRFNVDGKPYRAIMIAIASLLIRWVLMATAQSYSMILISTMLHGVSVGFALPAQNYLITKLVPANQRSSAFLFNITMSGAIVPSILNLITGQIVENMGYAVFGYTYLVLVLIALFIALPQFLKEKKCNNMH